MAPVDFLSCVQTPRRLSGAWAPRASLSRRSSKSVGGSALLLAALVGEVTHRHREEPPGGAIGDDRARPCPADRSAWGEPLGGGAAPLGEIIYLRSGALPPGATQAALASLASRRQKAPPDFSIRSNATKAYGGRPPRRGLSRRSSKSVGGSRPVVASAPPGGLSRWR